MRNYTNTLIFESALDSVTNTGSLLNSCMSAVMSPVLRIVEEDCETSLGEVIPVSDKAEGRIWLDTELPLSVADITGLISSGKTEVHVRSLSACISEGGVCRKCLSASRPGYVAPATGTLFQFTPEVIVDTSRHSVVTGQTFLTLPYPASSFDKVYVYDDGVLISDTQYTVSGSTLTFNVAASSPNVLFLKYAVNSYSQYYHWLSRSFGASLLGIKPLFNSLLPIPRKVLTPLVPEFDLEDLIAQLKQSPAGAEDSVVYLDSVTDKLEKTILACLLASVFLSAQAL